MNKDARMQLNRIVSQLGLGASLLAASTAPVWAADATKNFGLDVKITAQSEDDRDLGTRSGHFQRALPADPAPGSGDESRLILQGLHYSSSPSGARRR